VGASDGLQSERDDNERTYINLKSGTGGDAFKE
jgi:hypothetical protein